jgi:hypothetical protein
MEQSETLGMLRDHVTHGLSSQFHAANDWFWNLPVNDVMSTCGYVVVSVSVVLLPMGTLFGGVERWGNDLVEKGKERDDR